MKTILRKVFILSGFTVGLLANAHAAYFNPTPLTNCNLSIVSTMSRGSSGDDVLTLQNYLFRTGYLHAYPNGYFGYGTQSAVRAFQADNGIRATGAVGASTRDAVNERLCDDGDTLSDDGYGYFGSSNSTYVSGNDPFVTIVNAPSQNPALYATPQANIRDGVTLPAISIAQTPVSNVINGVSSVVSASSVIGGDILSTITPANSQIQGTSIVYAPGVGYTISLTQKGGSLTFTSPLPRSTYNEGDTIAVNWTTNNISATTYEVRISNKNSRQEKVVAVTSSNSANIVLTKELLDALCMGVCLPNDKDTFTVSVATPIKDIAGNVTTFKADMSPLTINRIFNVGSISLSTSKTPVDNNEVFKLRFNIPQAVTTPFGNYIYKVKAVCPSGVVVSLGGNQCGNEFALPFGQSSITNELPVIAKNSAWYTQTVTFVLTASLPTGQVVGQSETTVQINGAPFGW